jgi:uracil-DNA glycosylase
MVGGRARPSGARLGREDTPQPAGTTRPPAGCVSRVTSVSDAAQRREELKAVWEQASACQKCPQLASTRQTVVFGAGNADADLMFVGEAPGAREDERGLPFVGQAGRLLDQLLQEIGLQREDVFIANVLKCRPPGNRDPLPQEIDNCQDYLFKQLELIRPKVICSLGNFSTKLLRGDPTGITRLHGRDEIRTIGPRTLRLYPIFHPAAALYTPRMLETLREDFARLPELLALPAPPQPERAPEPVVPERELVAVAAERAPSPQLEQPEPEPEREQQPPAPEPPGDGQLGLF